MEHPPTHRWVPGAASVPLSCGWDLSVPFSTLFSIPAAQDRPQEALPGPGRSRKGGAGSTRTRTLPRCRCCHPAPRHGSCNLLPAGKPFPFPACGRAQTEPGRGF